MVLLGLYTVKGIGSFSTESDCYSPISLRKIGGEKNGIENNNRQES